MAQSGGLAAGFGINSTLYSNSTFTLGTPIPPAGSIDWFLGSSGRNVIDQTNPLILQSLLQGTAINPTYVRRQNGAVHSLTDGTKASGVYKELIDAVWARDEFGGSGGTDQTALGIGSKNGQGPELWGVVSGSVLGKNDLIDVGGHMFRNIDKSGSPNKNDLWFVGLINRAEPNGDAYMDFEFFIKDVSVTPGVGFTSGGDDLGHTAFQFDGSGNFSRMGDMLYNMSLTNGGTTVGVEVRVWVSYADYAYYRANPNSLKLPFTFGENFDGPVNGSPFGYASIVPRSQTPEMYGFVNSASQLPDAPPWGSRTTKSNIWVSQYSEYSIAEMGLNLTAIGLDDYLLSTNNPCDFSWRTFIVKTRSSASFTAALKDFAGPYSWGRPSVDITASNATLDCSKPIATLTPVPVIADATFSWSTTDGHILGSTTSTSIQVDRPGTYLLTATLSSGCIIQSPPFIVTSSINLVSSAKTAATISCSGNDGTVDLTVTGGTASRTYSWTKDGGAFSATTEDISGLAPGTYVATITYDSGCTFVSDAAVVQARTPVTVTTTATNTTCFGDKNGGIDLTVTSGKSPYTYLWNNGQTSQDLTNIGAGTYTVTITDADGCKSSFGTVVSQPLSALSISITKVDDTNPASDGTGSATLSVTGGTTPYAYNWLGTGTFSSTTKDLLNLDYGSYSVTVTDAHGCNAVASVFIYQPEICGDNIDNDGDGLTDCEDIADCKPASPTVSGDLTPCAGSAAIYTISSPAASVYQWQYPINATNVSGQGTSSLTVTWQSAVPGQICVQAQSSSGCLSNVSCITVTPSDKPVAPTTILKN